MKCFVDLHIHSALSPCAENEMTPQNIVNTALNNGLHAIALTDHNSAKNCRTVLNCAAERNLLFLPGMEVETCEEVHVICLFSELNRLALFENIVQKAMPAINNSEDFFGQQLIINEKGEVVGKEERLLLCAANITLTKVWHYVEKLEGVMFPAHVDRVANSILTNLGTVPSDIKIELIEISRKCNQESYILSNPELSGYKIVKSSDAHRLEEILPAVSAIEIRDYTPRGVIDSLRRKKACQQRRRLYV